MCGIIGFIGEQDSVGLIIKGLKNLEYRGYDSAGIAVYGETGAFSVIKRQGRLRELESAINETPICGRLGIGHTRWATHGEPSDINSHPHLGSKSRIAIVHNGIIENYKALQEMLMKRGVEFTSETDSEVVAQLAEYYYDGNLLETVIKVVNALEGSFALGIMCLDEPDKLIAIKKDNPLIVGASPIGSFIASDVCAILEHTREVHYLEDKEIAVLSREGISFYTMDGDPMEKTPLTITWSLESAEKGGFEHFMFKEIMEQPQVIKNTINSVLAGDNGPVLESVDIRKFNRLMIVACGSAYYVGVAGKYVLESLCRIPVEVDLASEFRYRDPLVDDKTLVMLVSQSGETADTIAAMREAKRRGATTLAIVNVVGSTIAKEADYSLFTIAGPEIAVATTKAFSAQLIHIYMTALDFALKLGRITVDQVKTYMEELRTLPDKISDMLSHVDSIQQFASTSYNSKSIFFIARNLDFGIALEGSLKMKEISYIHSEAYAGGELKHGPISLIEQNTLVVAICANEELLPKTMSNIAQVISRGARVLFLTNLDVPEEENITVLTLPKMSPLFSPSLSVVALQLFAYYVAAYKGLDIDKPRNLAKSVTVE